MTRLEDRYRRLLRVLPAWYRAEREDEMVDVFLEGRAGDDSADLDAEYGWPGWGETASVAGLAVRTRVGGDGAPAGPRRVGDTVRAAAVGAVLINAAGAAVTVLWQLVAIVVGPSEAGVVTDGLLHPAGVGWWSSIAFVLGLCWLPAWTALTSGRRGGALVLAAAACVPDVVALVLPAGPSTLMTLAFSLFELATVALLLLGFHRDAALPEVAHPWAWLGGAVAVLAVVAPLVLVVRQTFEPEAAALLLAAVAVAVSRRGGPVSAGVAVLAGDTVVSALLELAVLDAGYAGPVITVVLGGVAMIVAAATARRPDRSPVGT
ncbi:hypothetical protein ACR9E3_16680 [Actinomycetospora sp. C-140]